MELIEKYPDQALLRRKALKVGFHQFARSTGTYTHNLTINFLRPWRLSDLQV
jgi:hypothetical protein